MLLPVLSVWPSISTHTAFLSSLSWVIIVSSADVASSGSSALPSLNWPRSSLSTVSKISLRISPSMLAARASAVRPTSVARFPASVAAVLARFADSPAAVALASVSVMRPSAARTRSCVSSRVVPIVVTLSFTSPTDVRTNPFVAHAGATLIAATITPAVIRELRMIISLLFTFSKIARAFHRARASPNGTRYVTAAGSHYEVLVRRPNFYRVPSRLRARLEGDQIQVAQFVDHRSRRLVCRRGVAAVIQRSAGPPREVFNGANRWRSHTLGARGGALVTRIVDRQYRGNDVDRHVDRRRFRRDLRGREPACVIDAVCEHDDCASRERARRHAIGGRGNGIM